MTKKEPPLSDSYFYLNELFFVLCKALSQLLCITIFHRNRTEGSHRVLIGDGYGILSKRLKMNEILELYLFINK